MKVYGLIARGCLKIDGSSYHHFSKNLFCSTEKAENHIPVFRKLVCNPISKRDFFDLKDDATLKIKTVEFELNNFSDAQHPVINQRFL